MTNAPSLPSPVTFRGGALGALAPFLTFLLGVAWLGLSGAPDERGFWPILLISLGVGFLTSTSSSKYAEAVLFGMSRPIVLLMVMAWVLAGVLGSLVGASGLVEAMAGLAQNLGLSGGGFAASAFLISAALATTTGTSLGTLLVCAPLLYPLGGPLGADPVWLIGAILGGATFGDNLSPISDTTIASASTQEAEMGAVVKSRMVYAIPAAIVAVIGFLVSGDGTPLSSAPLPSETAWRGLLGAAGPLIAVVFLLRQRHLVEALMAGTATAALVGVLSGATTLSDLVFVDSERFVADGLLLSGMERAVGISIFTILLMGLVGGVEASGIPQRFTDWVGRRATTRRQVEGSIFAAVSGAVILTTHSVVAILMVGPFAKEAGQRIGLPGTRRANVLDVAVCTYPFLLPFFIPTILAASQTATGEEWGMPRVSPLDAGLANLHSWALLLILLLYLWTGWFAGADAPKTGLVTSSGEDPSSAEEPSSVGDPES